MLESPAYRMLSKTGLRVLALLEVELARRGGEGNGRLVLTYKDCVGSGIDRHAIHPALLEVQALGFVECTEKGHSAESAERRRPSRYRLTYARFVEPPFTDEWRGIKTSAHAAKIAAEARKGARAREAAKRASNKKRLSGGFATISVGETPTESGLVSVGKTPTTAMVGKPPLLSKSGVRGGERRAPHSAVASSSPLVADQDQSAREGELTQVELNALATLRGLSR